MASKSKKRRRVFRASCILAALIIAGSSFAWFTSSDEVTNRLSANADYDVSIVESFAPPKNFLPGQEVNKDVYAVNTGSIGAFVEEKISGKLSITTVDKIAANLTDGVAAPLPTDDLTHKTEVLTSDEVYSIEAGAFLAYKPKASTNELGNQIVAFKNDGPIKYYNVNNADEAPIDQATYDSKSDDEKKNYVAVNTNATDFAPTTEGLYIFRRAIDVANDRIETFDYAGYYFKDGIYYKVSDLAVTSDDRIDLADDGDFTDGYVKSATFNFLQDKTEVVTPELSYDAMNNRLIAKYGNKGTDTAESALKTLAQTLDQKEHELAEARAQLDRSILDAGKSDAAVQAAMNKVAQLEAELAAVNQRIADVTAAKTPIDTQVTTLNGAAADAGSVAKAKADANAALAKLYGATVTVDANTTDGNITYSEPTASSGAIEGTTLKSLLVAKENLATAKTNYADSTFAAYAKELIKAFPSKLSSSDTYDTAVAKLDYADLIGSSAPQFTAEGDDELHDINALTVKLLSAREAYEADRKDAEDKVADWNNKKNHLGTAGTAASPATTSTTESIAGVSVTYDKANENTDATGLLAEQDRLAKELTTLNNKKTALESVISTQRTAAATAAGASIGASDNTAKEQLEREQNEYVAAFQAYETALNNYNAAKTAYDTQNKELLIYINLADVVTTAGEKDKWQLLPTTVANNTAYFYYTGILEAGETSSKLIDSVELDKNATQDMYKSFDFDLNVELKSAQITYADDQKTILTTAAGDELDANPSLYENTNIETAVAWTAKT